MYKNRMIKITQMAMLSAVAIIFMMFIRFPIIPSAPFLIYDIAGVPIILATIIYGTVPAAIILLVASIIQAFTITADGLIGMIMNFTSFFTLIFILGLVIKKGSSFKKLILGMVIGSLAMAIIMVPMNYIFTVNFYGIPKDVIDSLIFSAIIPFNLIKSSTNCILSLIVYSFIKPFLYNHSNIFGITRK